MKFHFCRLCLCTLAVGAGLPALAHQGAVHIHVPSVATPIPLLGVGAGIVALAGLLAWRRRRRRTDGSRPRSS